MNAEVDAVFNAKASSFVRSLWTRWLTPLSPSPDTLLGRERGGLSASDAARVFEAPKGGAGG